MTSSEAFRCVQAWLQEKPAAWVGEDAPCLAAALMAQRPPTDALLEAGRSRQCRRIKLLEETVKCLVASVDPEEIMREVSYVSEEAVDGQAMRAQRAELALRWFEADETWGGEWDYSDAVPEYGGPTRREEARQ